MDAQERPLSNWHSVLKVATDSQPRLYVAKYRSSNDATCRFDTIASHIPVLNRDIPFILNITACPEARVLCGLGTPDEALIVHPDMPHRAIFRRESLEKKGQ